MNKKDLFDAKMLKISSKGIVLDIGGGAPFQKELSRYKDDFKASYYSLDRVWSSRPNLVGDGHKLPIKSKSVDSVILKSVLEHVSNSFLVVSEIHRVLKKNGKLLMWVPFIYPYHASKNYKDFYRFSKDGVGEILKNFKRVEIQPTRGYFETITNFLPKPLSSFYIIARLLDKLFSVSNQYSGFTAWASK